MYTIHNYATGEQIGVANINAEQYRHYEAMAQQPEGLIRLGALPHSYYELAAEFQGLSENTTVFLQ